MLVKNNNELTLNEIFSLGLGACQTSKCYKDKGVLLEENTPEEICNISYEMIKRLSGEWILKDTDKFLQDKFWDILPNKKTINGEVQYGEIKMTYGASFFKK